MNDKPLALFLACMTQRVESFGGVVGLNYPSVESAARMMGIEMTPDLFSAIRCAEREWLNILAERRREHLPKQ